MRLLCNLPLECFDEREALQGIELVTYGPPDRMLVDGVHFPFDVAFDPSTGSWDELAARLPRGFRPDAVLIWWPDQEPLPAGLEHCPVPVVGIVSDYNLSLPYLVGLWPFFDLLLCDRAGQDLFRRLSFADVRYWCQFAHKRPFHFVRPDAGPRDIDIGFAGNLNPIVQRDRAPWIERVRRLADRDVRVEVQTGVHGDGYGRFLNRCRIGWNRSIRGEMNLRAFEVPACGALLLMERDNLEVRDFFVPDEECVLYGDGDFEAIVAELLADRARCERIAAAGHRRVQEHRLGRRLGELAAFLARRGPGRPASSEADRVLGRAIAMLPTWAEGATIAAAALAAHELAPDDPRTLNLLGMATLRWRGADGGDAAWRLWLRAATLDPAYVPAAANLASLASATGDARLCAETRRELDRRAAAVDWSSLDGPVLPFGFTERTVDRALALQQAVRRGEPGLFASSLVRD
ncbi:MAG: glycosyltransferase family 1 protein [Planctomycetes bacterium]|nr:glycosyltransferase family 1 protein [Planctomycetota bacterium]